MIPLLSFIDSNWDTPSIFEEDLPYIISDCILLVQTEILKSLLTKDLVIHHTWMLLVSAYPYLLTAATSPPLGFLLVLKLLHLLLYLLANWWALQYLDVITTLPVNEELAVLLRGKYRLLRFTSSSSTALSSLLREQSIILLLKPCLYLLLCR